MSAVVAGPDRAWDAVAWADEVAHARRWLRDRGVRVLASLLDNGPAFLALDEAALAEGVVHLPLPLFFTPAQVSHALRSAGADTLVSAHGTAPAAPTARACALALAGSALDAARLPWPAQPLHPGTAKITFTSGTTAEPKGVCLSADGMQAVAAGVVQALAPLGIERHLSALPYAVLLENLAGAAAARLQGALVTALPLAQLGLGGSSRFDPAVFDQTVRSQDPHSLILLPQMLRAWCAHLAATRQRAPASLRFVAVGGAAVGAPLLRLAQALGVPAHEGYGLSEAGSVQTLNLPGATREGSAGRPLPHARVRINAAGEVEVGGSLHLGYLGAAPMADPWWPTGDLGHIDEAGHLHLQGRRRNVLITGFGRNVSPEWVETALQQHPAVRQAVVIGDGEAALTAVLWAMPQADEAALAQAVLGANAGLPDYARVQTWVRARASVAPDSDLFTANGRPRRDRIAQAYGGRLSFNDHPHTEDRHALPRSA